jgi:hypothetical protein
LSMAVSARCWPIEEEEEEEVQDVSRADCGISRGPGAAYGRANRTCKCDVCFWCVGRGQQEQTVNNMYARWLSAW